MAHVKLVFSGIFVLFERRWTGYRLGLPHRVISKYLDVPYIFKPSLVFNWELLGAYMFSTRRIDYYSGPYNIIKYLPFRNFVFNHTVKKSTPVKRRPVFVYPVWFNTSCFDDEPVLILFDHKVWAVPINCLPCCMGKGFRYRCGVYEEGVFLFVPGDWGFVVAFGVPVFVPRAVLAEYFRKLDCCL